MELFNSVLYRISLLRLDNMFSRVVCVLCEGKLDVDSEIEIHIDHFTQKMHAVRVLYRGVGTRDPPSIWKYK